MGFSSPRPRSCPRAIRAPPKPPAPVERLTRVSLLLRAARMAAILAAFALSLDAVAADASRWGKGYVPNHPVLAQDGKSFNFYDDLIQDRIAVVSFIYTSCSEICPVATARLSQLQEKLGDHMGRDVFFYSITVDPETDTPARMQTYAKTFGAGPGWLFLTGKPEHINEIRYRLGERSRFLGEHRNDLLLSNGLAGQWQRDSAMGDLDRLVLTIQSLNPAAFGTAALASRPRHQLEAIELTGPPGETLYLKACAGCHSIDEGNRVGPDLAGVTQRRQPEWLINFIANPAKIRASKDPIALELAARFPTVRMPSIGVSEREAADLIAYIEGRPLAVTFGLVPGQIGSYTLDHTLKTYILDRQAHMAGASDHASDPEQRRVLLKKLARRE